LLLSGVFAFGVNVTVYLIIGKTSPVTYAVVGHTKTVLILLFGFVVMHEVLTGKNFAGLLVAFLSIVAYTHFSISPASTGVAKHQQGVSEDLQVKSGTSYVDVNPLVGFKGSHHSSEELETKDL
jgi:K+-sensing histidine kinase KdpD